MTKISYSIFSIVISLVFFISCGSDNFVNDPNYKADIEHWQQLRVDSLKGHTGYINLAGLYWINDNVSSIGSSEENTFVFPEKASPFIGKIIVMGDSIWFVQHESGKVKIEGGIKTDSTLVFVNDEFRLTMRSGDLNWFIIKRGDVYGIRLRDYKLPLLDTFNDIENYPINSKWNVEARWEQYAEPKMVTVHNQVGMDLEQPVPGALHFKLEGHEYSLEPIGSADDEEFFVMIYDETSGHSTYGSGRYLSVPRADENGMTRIDFNKAYNPPCAYTDFATCLFPHAANRMAMKIEAGEKYSESH